MKPPQKNQVICGSNLEVTKPWPSNCIDAICTDPPYGLEFMGKDWDKGLPGIRFWREFLRITKPGGFLFCFGGTRTVHRLACAIEDAGWEIRDCMMWLYGSGFPKSHNIGKAIDKLHGNKRMGTGIIKHHAQKGIAVAEERTAIGGGAFGQARDEEVTIGNTRWEGYGTALKPAWEPIIVAMKPLDGTFAHNAEAHGVAGLNIDEGRIGSNPGYKYNADKNGTTFHGQQGERIKQTSDKKGQQFIKSSQGRWPANLILDEEAGAMLDEQTGTKKSGFMAAGTKRQMSDNPNKNTYGKFNPDTVENDTYGDSGGASRFFYCAKTSRKERNMGMENCEDKLLARSGGAQGAENRGEKEYLQKHIGLNRVAVVKNNHPTVKPLALMKYLCILLKMPGSDQIILDPFLGSGTTGIACKELGINFIGIEKEREYCEIAVKRIAAVSGQEITLHTEITLPVTKNVETFRATTDSVGGGRRPNESLPHVSESRQRIINAASAALRRNRK